MNYQIIILIAISAVIIYFSIAELVWQLRNRHFRRRLIIGVIITALLVSHIDFINLFTKTDAEVVSAAAADAETDTESVKVSAIEKLSDRIKGHAADVETAPDVHMDPDAWEVVRISVDMDTDTVEGAEVDEKLLAEEGIGDTEGETLTETEESTEEENSAENKADTEEANSTETERNTEEDNSAETEKDTEEENSSEPEKDTEESPAEEEKGTEEESSTEQESSAEGILEENSMEDSTESEQFSDEAEPAADTKTTKQAEEASKGRIAVLSDDDVMLIANTDHDSITNWTPWEDDSSLPMSAGNYYLTKNVTLSSTWKVEGNINLCMNGKTLTGSISNPDATLNIYNCNGTHKTYTITYKPGKYGNGEVVTQTKIHGQTTTLSDNIFGRTGYTQTGWAVSDGGALKYKPLADYAEDRNITLYPVWEADKYEINYVRGTCDEGVIEGDVGPQTKVYGKTLILSKDTFTYAGHKQTGWAISDGGVKVYDLGGKYVANEAATLYPVWADVYTITYEPAGENCTGKSVTQTKIQGKDITLSKAIFTRTGYKQIGWTRDYNVKKIDYELEGSYKEDSNITLYPVWAEAYKVTYHKDGGTIKHEDDYTSYAYGVGLELPEPTKSGYVFRGWYKDPDFSGSPVSNISKTSRENRTFYAKWEEISTEEYDYYEDSYDDSDDGNSSSDSGSIGNTQPGTNEQTESDEDDTDDSDETDEDEEDDLSSEDTDDSKSKRKEKEEEDDDTDDTDSSDDQTGSDADDDMESSKESKKGTGEAGTKSANRSVQAGLENGEIVISDNPDGSNGTGAGGNSTGRESSGEESANASIGTGTIPGEESAVTVLTVGEGSVIVTVVSDGWQYGAGVADTVAVANTVLTSEQKKLVNSGENIEIRLVVKDISGQVSGEERDVIESGLNAGIDGKSGKLVPVAYIDISMDIRTGDGEWKAITRTDQPIQVVVGVSEEWSDGRTFYIARSHESEYALLEDLDSESDTVTIMTELFSTYALVYQQMFVTAPEISIGAEHIYDFLSSHSRATVACIGIALLYIGIMEILGIIVILILGRQYKKEKEDVRREMVNP